MLSRWFTADSAQRRCHPLASALGWLWVFGWLWVCGLGAPAAASTPLLSPDTTLRGELRAPQVALFAVTVPANSYLEIAAEQSGVDFEVRLRAAVGEVVSSVDRIADASETEWLFCEVSAAGTYQVELRAKSGAGHYRVKLADLRPATAADRQAMPQWDAYYVARELQRTRRTRPDLLRAIELFTSTLATWQALDQPLVEASTLDNIGFVHRLLEQVSTAVTFYELALPLWRKAGDRINEANTWINLGAAQYYLDDLRAARTSYEHALALLRSPSPGSLRFVASAQDNLAQVDQEEGKLASAHSWLRSALTLRQQTQDVVGQARTLNNLGSVATDLDKLGDAQGYLEQALALAAHMGEEGDQAAIEAAIFSNLGIVAHRRGEPQDALDFLRQSLALNRKRQDRKAEADVLRNLGNVYLELGELDGALQNFNEAHELNHQLGRRADMAQTLLSAGWVHAQAGRPVARPVIEKAIAILRELGQPFFLAAAWEKLGKTLIQLGDFSAAQTALESADELSAQLGDVRRQGRVALGFAQLTAERGQPAAARFTRALKLATHSNDIATAAEALTGLAREGQRTGDLGQAQADLATALDLVEKLRDRTRGARLRSALIASRAGLFELAVELAMMRHAEAPGAGHEVEAFELHQRAQKRGLLDWVANIDVHPDSAPAAYLVRAERELRQAINAREEQLERLDPPYTDAPALPQKLVAAQEEAVRQHDEILGQLRQAPGRLGELVAAQPLPLAELQRTVLDPDTALLVYALGKARSFVWVITAQHLVVRELLPRPQLETLAAEFAQLLTAPAQPAVMTLEERQAREQQLTRTAAEANRVGAQLQRALLQPIASTIAGKRLALMLDGALQNVPFAALPGLQNPDQPLLAEHEIVVLESASVLAVMRRELAQNPPLPTTQTLAIVADPVLTATDPRLQLASQANPARDPSSVAELRGSASPGRASLGRASPGRASLGRGSPGRASPGRLPHAAREANTLAALLPRAQVLRLEGFAASREQVLSGQLAPFRILHFATHAFLHERLPELSGLWLTNFAPDGQALTPSGTLRLHDIFQLDLHAELVVLSACNTGTGHEVRGEGLISLTRGFFHAGAPRVVASLWPVDDAATAEFMTRFYTGMLQQHLRPAAALRHAQLSLWQNPPQPRWRHPYFWAGFVLFGEWR